MLVSASFRKTLAFSWIRFRSPLVFLLLGFAFLARMRLVFFELEAMVRLLWNDLRGTYYDVFKESREFRGETLLLPERMF